MRRYELQFDSVTVMTVADGTTSVVEMDCLKSRLVVVGLLSVL